MLVPTINLKIINQPYLSSSIKKIMLTAFLYMILILLSGGGIAYWFGRQQRKANQRIVMEILRKNKKQVSEEILDKQVPYLKEWMRKSPIDAYTSATLPSNERDFVKTSIKDNDNINTVEPPAFFILSRKDLHFINTDEYHDLSEHIVFNEERLQTAEIKFAGVKKEMCWNMSVISKKDSPKIYDIIIKSEKGKSTLQAIDRIIYTNFPTTDITQMFRENYVDRAKAKVTSELFFETLGNLYPHLKKEITH